ncbi:MAG TPA: hypothetical protein VHU92_11030 [Streptosporangiaceae bacterium]|jgi:hypothetical protein|nr:hypothetical protein [Streptosporangiaceae bacterium]
MNQLSRITPVSDAEAARLVRPDTLADLASDITATAPSGRHGHAAAAPRRARRRVLLIAAPLAAAGVAAAVVAASSIASPGRQHGSAIKDRPVVTRSHPATRHRTTEARVLSFVRHGGYIIVKVRDPLADPARYNAEFARHHLHIRLTMVPVSPSLVGTVVYMGLSQGASPITPITAQGRCFTGGGGSACPVGVRVPADFHGNAVLTFGRAARPGEKYESTTSAFAPGEVMHGMSIKGETVAQVVAALRARHVTVPLFNRISNNIAGNVPRVPGNWYVYDAVPWAPGQVMLFVGPTRTQPVPRQPTGKGAPKASPTAAAGLK